MAELGEGELLKDSAKMYRDPLTPEEFQGITRQQGAYDVFVRSSGEPQFVNRDQIGFRMGDLNFVVAFQPERNKYEVASFRDGETMTILGEIDALGSDREAVRELGIDVVREIYQGLKSGELTDMQIPVKVREKLDAFKNAALMVKPRFSAN